jgi:hypothetical protein
MNRNPVPWSADDSSFYPPRKEEVAGGKMWPIWPVLRCAMHFLFGDIAVFVAFSISPPAPSPRVTGRRHRVAAERHCHFCRDSGGQRVAACEASGGRSPQWGTPSPQWGDPATGCPYGKGGGA